MIQKYDANRYRTKGKNDGREGRAENHIRGADRGRYQEQARSQAMPGVLSSDLIPGNAWGAVLQRPLGRIGAA